jgi:uncharacterized damage-inducible protein DinB
MNNSSMQLAKHFKEMYVGKNWTWVNLEDTLADISFEQANAKIYDLNTIAALTFHITYYVGGFIEVIENGTLSTKDALSFDSSFIKTENDWQQFKEQLFRDANKAAQYISNLAEEDLYKVFVAEQYGNYFRNILGIIEHFHYHLGQISLIKKLVRMQSSN